MNWLITSIKKKNIRMKLFCFPHAGGGASTFFSWGKSAPDWIEISSLQYPGHETRITEPLSENFNDLVDQISEAIISQAESPYALFGHSMGGLLAYEVARKIRDKRVFEPVAVFISGRNSPTAKPKLPPISKLADNLFVAELEKRYGKFPKEIIDAPEIMQIYLPILRNDLSLVENYKYLYSPPLRCPLFLYNGKLDTLIMSNEMNDWRELTTGQISQRWFDGDHFYILNQPIELLNNLFKDMTNSLMIYH